MKKIILTTIIFLLILISLSFSQSLNFIGNINFSFYYASFYGDSSLTYISPDIQEGVYFSQKSQFTLNYILPQISINFNYQSQPKERLNLSIKTQKLTLTFNNELNANFSPLSLYNKNLNGIYGKYEEEKIRVEFLLGKLEGRKKIYKFYGNDTSGPFFIGDFFLIPYKERVYLNGILLERDQDYIIDYTYGIIYFNFNLSSKDEILIEYEILSSYETYNLYGLSLTYLPFSLSYLSLQNLSSKVLQSFLEFSLKTIKDNNNYLEFRRSYSFLESYYSGYADYLTLSFKFSSLKGNIDYINSTEGYPYMAEILGNYNLTPGKRNFTFNLILNSIPTKDFILSYLLQDLMTTRYHNLKLSSSFFKISLGYKMEEYKTIQSLQFSYTPAFLNISTQKTIANSSILETYVVSLNPQTQTIKTSLSISEKAQKTDSSIMKENELNGSFTLVGNFLEFSLGEIYKTRENLDPDTPISFSQNFTTDGETYIFELDYSPLQDSVNLYINNIYVENNSIFTYYLPDGTSQTYTVVYHIYENRVYIFFQEENNQIPPLSGLSITINYKAITPQKSYSKTTTAGLKMRYLNMNSSLSLQRVEKDNISIHNISLSFYGMILQNLWINLTGNKQLEGIKNNLSFNAKYYFNPSSIYFSLHLNETEYSKTLSYKSNLNLSFKPSHIIFSIEYYQSYYYYRFFKNIYYFVELKRSFSFGDIKLIFSQTWKESSYQIPYYKKDSQILSFSKNIFEGRGELSLSHEYYSNGAEKYLINLSFLPNLTFTNATFYINYIYSRDKDINLSILQIGGSGFINF